MPMKDPIPPPCGNCVALFGGTLPWIVKTPCDGGNEACVCDLPRDEGFIGETRTCPCDETESDG